jgi:hypothetical protein
MLKMPIAIGEPVGKSLDHRVLASERRDDGASMGIAMNNRQSALKLFWTSGAASA